jgi:hypothetical protein
MRFLTHGFFFAACLVAAQSPPSSAPKAESVSPLIKRQFGSGFAVTTSAAAAIFTADFDSDGVEDIAIVADSKDPLPDSYEFKYTVADPYNAFFGFGDPRHTTSFGRLDPKRNHHVLVIFGAGSDAWRAETPKAKFVLINVPFDTVEQGRMLVKKNKPPIFTIRAIEADVMNSVVFWDAKKKRWRWQPGDTIE